MKCCLKTCSYAGLDLSCRRVEVKSALPKGGIYKFRDCLAVNWKENGEAIFHYDCWEHVLLASQRRKRKTMQLDRSLEPLSIQMECEKEMVLGASETAEIFDSMASVVQAAARIAKLIKSSKHCVVFTGAGISTSAGLGDYRGKEGKWTEQDREAVTIKSDSAPLQHTQNDHGESSSKNRRYHFRDTSTFSKEIPEEPKNPDQEEETEEEVEYEALRPTFTHEAIQWMVEENYVKHVVSQNCDGLHRLSGIPQSKISELHGNVFIESCEKCGARYERSFYVCDDIADIYLEELEDHGKTDVIPPKFMFKCRKCGLSHRTGRKCEKKSCNGYLKDTIINFKDHLEENILDTAFTAARACDLMICLGTTLTVNPAAGIVDLIKRPHRIVICNRQPTKRDRVCIGKDKNGYELGARVYADCDILMKQVMMCLLEDDLDKFESRIFNKKKEYDDLRKLP
ncbi:hypothetical protein EGW08_019342 [Elysia chlorotica]|uniref:protein acetyllysine N-acetyltransferase n=1 Tax=Elysia chlorotica TaxID=188477 RepID=A0A433SUF7_ELYCH|nr:hypothetical protein EGW08_019342 [Elysia chlorotica]